MEPVPKSFDWVRARAECSLERLFRLLAETVDSDVRAVSAIKRPDQSVFEVIPALHKVIVSRTKDTGGIPSVETVVFELVSNGIHVRRGKDTSVFTATPVLDARGDCRLEVSGESLELWQVSRKALEGLFFGQ